MDLHKAHIIKAPEEAQQEYIPTIADLQEIFSNPNLPPADRVNATEMKIGIQISKTEETPLRPLGLSIGGVALQHTVNNWKTFFITLKKFNENNKLVWIYEGKIKYR